MGGSEAPSVGPAPGRGGGSVVAAGGRRVWLDNLKVLLISLIIVIHGVLSYSSLEVWTYTEHREVTLNPTVEAALFLVAAPFGLFMIPLLFLVSGMLTPGSLERKGVRRFVVDRLLRLGVPFAVFVLVVEPALIYWLTHAVGVAAGPWGEEYLVVAEGRLDTGPLWFVGVLLIFSVAYAGWAAVRSRADGGAGRSRLVAPPEVPARGVRDGGAGFVTVPRLLAVAAGVAVASFLIRLAYPYGSEAGPSDLNFWEWPACVAAFGLGVVAAGQGWVDEVPDGIRRGCRRVTVVAFVAMAALLLVAGWTGRFDELLGGWSGWALAFALVEAPLAVCGPVWLLGVAQRHLDRRYPGDAALTRAAFGAFVVQGVVLIGLSLALRPLDLPAEVKALVVGFGGLVGAFALAWALVRLPGVRRVL